MTVSTDWNNYKGEELLFQLVEKFGDKNLAFSSSLGLEDQLITHWIFSNDLPIRVFTLDTGRLFAETYELIQRTEARYGKKLEIFFPKSERVEEYVAQNGINGFTQSVEQRKSCCYVRKVEPLNRALKDVDVWITGLRGGQSENRSSIPALEWDETRDLLKANPLHAYSQERVELELNQKNIPVNPLHAQGYPSIGCQPCTRAILSGEDERAGRWWWETSAKECGLHSVKAVNPEPQH